MRVTLLVIAALATGLLLAACGGSGEQEQTVRGGTLTVPSDVHGVFPELEALLAQLPYQGWYKKCVITRVKKELSPKEAEALEAESESGDAAKAEKIIAAAAPACEKSSNRPLLDPNASEKELALYRGGLVEPLVAVAEEHGFEGAQVECVEETTEGLSGSKVVALGNGTHKVREAILLSVLAHCVKPE